jgi:small nuclear ribonucleoprotein (snRNP)-like protein
MLASTRKDIAKSIKTLLVVLQSMRGQQVVITLRNDSNVTGTIVKVDSNMNIELSDVLIEPDLFYSTTDLSDNTNQDAGVAQPYLLVKGTRIRHIEVPDKFDLIKEAKQEITRIKNRTKQWTKDDIV